MINEQGEFTPMKSTNDLVHEIQDIVNAFILDQNDLKVKQRHELLSLLNKSMRLVQKKYRPEFTTLITEMVGII